jgi:hypothetical protein
LLRRCPDRLPEGTCRETETSGSVRPTGLPAGPVAGALPPAPVSGRCIDPTRGTGVAGWALILSSGLHGVIHAGHVRLVGRAGADLAARRSRVVTGTGVLWATGLPGERYSIRAWSALVILAGLVLVQPRHDDAASRQAA